MAYPTQFPLTEVKTLMSVLSKESKPSFKELHYAFYEVWGYAAGQYFEATTVPVFTALPEGDASEELLEQLKFAYHQYAIPGVVAAAGVNWGMWLKLLLKVLPLVLAEAGE